MNIDTPAIVVRLFRLYEHSRLHRAAAASGAVAIRANIMGAGPIPSRLEAITDSEGCARYAAWVIGETLCLVAGRELMDQVFDAFEAAHGVRAASWLDHRWSGVGGNVWCA
ncbi:MAG: hypothetical protein PGN23_15485 [Sphingomonas adhaesiva]|uniref:hypothetical protein n=1 Tax=Sphingomonas adhaesiva TaxID=28212 RepID=UPI002FF652B4